MAFSRCERLRFAHLNCNCLVPEDDTDQQRLPVVLIHGLGGGTWGWENFQNYFAAQGRASYALELPLHAPGAGVDPRLGSYSVETYALHCAAAVAQIGPCFVIGHSMGGLIAQKLAETIPNPGYVFLCSAPPWHMFRKAYWPMWKHVLCGPLRQLFSPVRRDSVLMADGMAAKLVNNRIPVEERAELAKRDVPDSGRATLQMILGLVKVDERHIASPCLVVGGEADGLIRAEEQRRIAQYFGCPLRLFDRGHMLIIEEGWEEVAAYLDEWMCGLEAARGEKAAGASVAAARKY